MGVTLAENINQIYDKTMKRILTLSNTAVINLINALFEKSLALDSEIIYNWTESIKDNLDRIIADAILTVNSKDKFHIECQIDNDATIVIRVFEYGFQEALKYKVAEGDKIILTLPQAKIIYLESGRNTPSEVSLIIRTADKNEFAYTVPTMKLLDYSIEELNKQRMVILMPLYLLKLRNDISKGATAKNASELKELMNNGIIKSIEENQRVGNISSGDCHVLIGLLEKLYKHLYGNIELFKEEGVANMLAEKLVLDFEVAREEKTLEIAKEMLRDGAPIENIMKWTKLSADAIHKLQMKAN